MTVAMAVDERYAANGRPLRAEAAAASGFAHTSIFAHAVRGDKTHPINYP